MEGMTVEMNQKKINQVFGTLFCGYMKSILVMHLKLTYLNEPFCNTSCIATNLSQ